MLGILIMGGGAAAFGLLLLFFDRLGRRKERESKHRPAA